MIKAALCICFCLLIATQVNAEKIRIKDLVSFDGVRGNDLVGYGLVVGLNGTGDGIRNAPFTEEIMSNILERLGVNITGEKFRPKNVAAVFVTAELPAFSRAGASVDVTVSAIGDANSLLLKEQSLRVVPQPKAMVLLSFTVFRPLVLSPPVHGWKGRLSLIFPA
jgi:flagellar P-ring protein precursor FlgI